MLNSFFREVIKEIGEEKNLVFRFQKVLSGYKKKFNSLLQVKKSLIEEQPQRIPLEESNYEDDDQDETDNLLESMKIEVIRIRRTIAQMILFLRPMRNILMKEKKEFVLFTKTWELFMKL